jgi:hypothetical protein
MSKLVLMLLLGWVMSGAVALAQEADPYASPMERETSAYLRMDHMMMLEERMQALEAQQSIDEQAMIRSRYWK